MYEPVYTTYDELVRLIGASKLQVRIGSADSDHISEENARLCIRDSERKLTARLAEVYVQPIVPFAVGVPVWVKDTLAQIALYLSGVSLWDAVPGNVMSTDARPASVVMWKQQADELLTPILERKYVLTGLVMRGPSAVRPVVDADRPHLYPTVRGPNSTGADSGYSTAED